MMVGKLSILIENHPTLGKIFVIRANNNEANIFDIEGNHLTLRVTKETAILLSQYVDESIEEEFLNVQSNSSASN